MALSFSSDRTYDAGAASAFDGPRAAPGKTSATARLQLRRADAPVVQRRAAAPTAAGVATAAGFAPDDPFGLHLLGGPVQRQAGAEATTTDAAVHAAAARGLEGGATSLPYLAQIASSFGPGHDVAGIEAHVGGAATAASAAMGAQAYATGNHVAFAGAPDLHTAAHEAAHVVQQRSGVHLKGGVGEAGDPYEQHADAVADRVVQGRSAADLLGDTRVGSSTATGPIQRKIVHGSMEFKVSFRIENKTGSEEESAAIAAAKQTLDDITRGATGVALDRNVDAEVYYFVNGLRSAGDPIYDLATTAGVTALASALREQFPGRSTGSPVASVETSSKQAPDDTIREGVRTRDDQAAYLKRTYGAELDATHTRSLVEHILASTEHGYQQFSDDFAFYTSATGKHFQANTTQLTVPDIDLAKQDSALLYPRDTATQDGSPMAARAANGLSIEDDCRLIAEHELVHLKILANNRTLSSRPETTVATLEQNPEGKGEDELVDRAFRILELLGPTFQEVSDKQQYRSDDPSLHWPLERISYALTTKYGDKGQVAEDSWHELPTTIRELRRYLTSHQAAAGQQMIPAIGADAFAEIQQLVKELDDLFAQHEGYEPVTDATKT